MPHTVCSWGLPAGGQGQGRWPVRCGTPGPAGGRSAPPAKLRAVQEGRRGSRGSGRRVRGGRHWRRPGWPPISARVPGAVVGRPRPIGRGGCRGKHVWAAQEQSRGSGAAGARQAAAASACPVQPAAALRPGADRKSVQTCPTQTVHSRAADHGYEGIVTKSTSQEQGQQQLGAGGQSRNRRGGAGQQPGGCVQNCSQHERRLTPSSSAPAAASCLA